MTAEIMVTEGRTLDALTAEQLAYKLSVTTATLRSWRRAGRGPRFTKPEGTRGYYMVGDVLTWLEEGGK